MLALAVSECCQNCQTIKIELMSNPNHNNINTLISLVLLNQQGQCIGSTNGVAKVSSWKCNARLVPLYSYPLMFSFL